ncbi:hypothetical protein [Sandarakinorhabdus sp.]|uniref:hypothetical protein n=1 Tax=Sandarakinorhabdus sp. TaxID=1916663 RepID=UPI00286DF3F4|nr:hypothetical protein [Sandarakinorhabdus sp.]
MAEQTIETPTGKGSDLPANPSWFDMERHVHTGRGVYERETGLGLAEDGLPISAMERARRLAAAGKKSDPLGHAGEGLIAAEALALKQEEGRAAEDAAAKSPAVETPAANPARKEK